jgi:hypothetical protein
MRRTLRRGAILTAFAGTCVLAMTATALAATNGPTTSPEAIGIYANGLASLGNTPDETSVGTMTASNVDVGTILGASTLSATVVSDNYSWAQVEGISALTGSILPVTATAVTTYCVASGAGNFSNSYVVIAGLSINGSTAISGTYTSAATLTGLTLPAGIASLSVTIDQETSPSTETVSGSETFQGVDIDLTTILGVSEDIDIASATCGPYTTGQGTPLASGKGLGIGLGAVGLLGGAYAVVRIRRRHAATGIAI